jgi:hypothetical protein
MKFRRCLVVVGTALIAIAMVLATPSAVAAAPPGKSAASKSGLQAGKDVKVAFRMVNEDGSKTDDASVSDCSVTATCIICEVFPWAPYQSGTIIIYQGGVYCYYPDQNYQRAPVVNIRMDLGIYREQPRPLTLVRSQPYQAAWTDHLDIIDAIPCSPGEYSTIMTVIVDFPECCPITGGGGFRSFTRPISCT